jgi:GNAT superfamily N-acetyltransferase
MCTAGLEIKAVTSFGDAQIMRNIRNECRSYMTNDTSYISFLRQTKWWRKVKNDPNWWLYLLWYNGSPIGYGIIRKKDMYWVSGGIISQSRGHGFGRHLFNFLTQVATNGHSAYLEVLKTNERAFNLYQSLGYRVCCGDRDGVLLMRADPS